MSIHDAVTLLEKLPLERREELRRARARLALLKKEKLELLGRDVEFIISYSLHTIPVYIPPFPPYSAIGPQPKQRSGWLFLGLLGS